MTKKNFQLIFVITISLAFNSCEQKHSVNIVAEMANVKTIVDDFEIFWETKDMNLLSKIMSHDSKMVNYGTEANEIFVGFDAFKDSITPMLSAVDGIKINVRNQAVNLSSDGNTAWFSEIWDWDIMMEGQTMTQNDQRLTGVLEKRGGNWVIVQFHNSVPARH